MPTKSVSIVMCTYNGEKYLREQLESIAIQTYPIFELIIQDDCSTDGTIEIIKEFAARYPYTRWKVNEKNLGYNANFRTALQSAKGELISIADQDDIWYANKLEELVKCIGNYSMCYAYSTFRKQSDVEVTKRALNLNNTLERQIFTAVLPGHGMLFQKTFIDQLHVWNDDIPYDWWLAVNAYFFDGACQCMQTLTDHRMHSESVTAQDRKEKVKAYTPYINGYANYKQLQQQPLWQFFYQHIHNESKKKKELTITRKVTGVMLQKSIFAFIRLCFLSMKYKALLMPRTDINRFRAFFYPCFYADQNVVFMKNKKQK